MPLLTTFYLLTLSRWYQALLDAGARVALTTHYTQLKELAARDSRFGVAAMQFVGGRPTYRLIQDSVGESFALQVRVDCLDLAVALPSKRDFRTAGWRVNFSLTLGLTGRPCSMSPWDQASAPCPSMDVAMRRSICLPWEDPHSWQSRQATHVFEAERPRMTSHMAAVLGLHGAAGVHGSQSLPLGCVVRRCLSTGLLSAAKHLCSIVEDIAV